MSADVTKAIPFPNWAGHPAVKLALVGVLLLLMLIPNAWVSGVIAERQERQEEAQREIGQSWGPQQSVLPPTLVVPYRAYEAQPNLPNGQPQPPLPVRGYIHVAANRVQVHAALHPEQRRRGLFAAVVYGADVRMEGGFTVPALTIPGHPEAELSWAEAFIAAGAYDLRYASPDTPLTLAGQALAPADDPPNGYGCGPMSFLRWNLPEPPVPGRAYPFATALTLRGTLGFHLVPSARQVEMQVSAPWDTPSFNGGLLPSNSDVTRSGFTAEWRDSGGGRNGVWLASRPMTCEGAAATASYPAQQLGVDLLEAVPTYRMVTRASKYAVLFLALSFLTYFLIEMLTAVRIHLAQYGLLGLSISLFALLLLALAEPLGFGPAYAGASVLVVAQATLYTQAVTRRLHLSAVFAASLSGLFGILYVVLGLESYALLAGAMTLFVLLSVVMAASNRVNWSARVA